MTVRATLGLSLLAAVVAACSGGAFVGEPADAGAPSDGDGNASVADARAADAARDAGVKRDGGAKDAGDAEYTVGGSLSGATGAVTLSNNASDTLTVTANGPFTFAQSLPNGSAYSVTVTGAAPGDSCAVTNGNGTVAGADVTNVSVTCAAATYTIGGTVSGLTAGDTVTLQDNGGDTLPVASNGGFTFAHALAHGAAYSVTVVQAPIGRTCSVANGAGTVGYANVTNVGVVCH